MDILIQPFISMMFYILKLIAKRNKNQMSVNKNINTNACQFLTYSFSFRLTHTLMLTKIMNASRICQFRLILTSQVNGLIKFVKTSLCCQLFHSLLVCWFDQILQFQYNPWKTNQTFLFSIFMEFLIFLAVLIITRGALYNFSDLTIRTDLTSSLSISNSSSNTCKKMVVGKKHVYHLSSQNIYKSWKASKLNDSQYSLNLTSFLNGTINDFDANDNQRQVLFLKPLIQQISSLQIYNIDEDQLQSNSQPINLVYNPLQVFINGNYIYQFSGSSIIKRSIKASSVTEQIDISQSCVKMAVSSDYSIGVVWNRSTSCFFYNLNNMSEIGRFISNNTTSMQVTSNIIFSKDNSYAIIETDSYNNLVILNIINFTVYKSFYVEDLILSAFFIGNDSSMVVAFGTNRTTFIDLSKDRIYQTPAIPATAYGVSDQQIFTCYNNTISQISASFVNISISEFNSSSAQQFANKSFTKQVDLQVLGNTGKIIFGKINSTLQTTSLVANTLANVALSTPITVYFLGFLNFISTSSLYVLLNFPIPEHVYNYLNLLYSQMGQGLFRMMSIDLEIKSISSQQKVINTKALQFGVSSDVVSQNKNNFFLFGFNMGVLLTLKLAFYLFLREDNFINKLFKRQMQFMVYGQFIGLIQQMILTWTFILFYGGVRNLATKVNQILFTVLLFTSLLFPFYYVYQVREQILLQQRQKTKLSQQAVIQRKLIYRMGTTILSLQNNPNIKTKNSILSGIELEESHMCQTNIIFPLLILLNNPVYFLVAIGMHDIFGVLVAAKRSKKRISCIALAIYPLLFHCSFMVFYWCDSVQILAFTQIVCLASLLIGFIHNICIIAAETIGFLFKIIRNFISRNQILPIRQEQNVLTCKKSIKKSRQPNLTKTKKLDMVQDQHLSPGSHGSNLKKSVKFKQRVQKSNDGKSHLQLKLRAQTFGVNGHKITMKKAKAKTVIDYLVVITNKNRE